MKRCTFKQASGALPPLDFVLPGLLVGTAGLIVGPGAVGKTFLALQIGIGIALGDDVCAGDGGALFPATQSGDVLVILGEDP
jgi:RecA-family ATPase